jgi:hypothetical protein
MINWLYRQQKPQSLLSLSGKDQVRATVVFRNADYLSFLNFFLKDGFSHVSVVIHKPEADVLFDPRVSYTEITFMPSNTDMSPYGTAVKVKREIEVTKLRGVIGLLSCVEQVKILLGIKNRWILTPYQLYKEITKNG